MYHQATGPRLITHFNILCASLAQLLHVRSLITANQELLLALIPIAWSRVELLATFFCHTLGSFLNVLLGDLKNPSHALVDKSRLIMEVSWSLVMATLESACYGLKCATLIN